jgi:hypothetical protein
MTSYFSLSPCHPLSRCHPEEGVSPPRDRTRVGSADAVERTFHAACTETSPPAPSQLHADVRSLTPASPPFRMTMLLFRDVILRRAQALRGTVRRPGSADAVERTIPLPAFKTSLPTPSRLQADVRSLAPASPPFRMTMLPLSRCHPEEGASPPRDRTRVGSADAVERTFHAACTEASPPATSRLPADVRSLTPASPPLRMTMLRFALTMSSSFAMSS